MNADEIEISVDRANSEIVMSSRTVEWPLSVEQGLSVAYLQANKAKWLISEKGPVHESGD